MSDTAHTFISAALQKIIDHSSARKHPKLIEKCKEVIDILKKTNSGDKDRKEPKLVPYEDQIPGFTGKSKDIPHQWDQFVNLVVSPLLMSCETGQPNIVEPGLDGLQKLILYGYIRDITPDLITPTSTNTSTATSTTSTSSTVPTTLAIRIMQGIKECIKYAEGKQGESVQLQISKALAALVTSGGIHGNHLTEAFKTIFDIHLMANSTEVSKTTSRGALSNVLTVLFARMKSARATTTTTLTTEGDPEINKGDSIFEEKTTSTPSRLYNTSTVQLPSLNISAGNSPGSSSRNSPRSTVTLIDDISDSESEGETDIAYKDCHLVFKFLCKVASKTIPDTFSPENNYDLQAKFFSLELLVSICEEKISQKIILDHTKFIERNIRKFLIPVICQSGLSVYSKVFKASLSLFLSAIEFRVYLKEELGILFSNVFLRILRSTNSSIQQKCWVVQGFLKICKSPQILIDIFVNYDCDVERENYFGDIVEILSRIAQGSTTSDTAQSNPTQFSTLKHLGLEALVSVVNSLAEHSKRLYYAPGQVVENLENFTTEDISKYLEDPAHFPIINSTVTLPPVGGIGIPKKKYIESKEKKSIIERAKNLFKLKPRKGIQFLVDHDIIEDSDQGIANFLKNTNGLDKTKIGEYLGEEKYKCVFHIYVDNHFNFTNMEVDYALRELLNWFRLPGEAQKIDRVVEKFAQKFFADNDGRGFDSSDAVYFLSFAIIMLATDRHSPQIRPEDKMTREMWKKNLSDTPEHQYNLDPKKLDEIFERVCAEPLKVMDDVATAPPKSQTEKQRNALFIQESEQCLIKSLSQLKSASMIRPNFSQEENVDIVKFLFEEVWGSLLAAFSVNLEESQDQTVFQFCLQGFKCAIRVAGIFYLETQRNAFLSALTKFTNLDNLISTITEKQVGTISTLIEISCTDGIYLRDSWKNVLKCVSSLERLHVIGSGGKVDDYGPKKVPIEIQEIQDKNALTIATRIKMSDIETIFINSKKLTSPALMDMVRSLCSVSREEINLTNPRLFSMQKINKLAQEIMADRSHFVWEKVWEYLSEHFMFAGSHKNKKVIATAVDSLKEIVLKYLSQETSMKYNFQKELMKPFEFIANTKTRSVRESVIESFHTIINSFAPGINSGWGSILRVLGAQYSLAKDEVLVTRSFSMLEDLCSGKYFDFVSHNFFSELLLALSHFASTKRGGELSEKAVELMRECALKLATGLVTIPNAKPTECLTQKYAHQWEGFTVALSRTITQGHTTTRRTALKVMFDTVEFYGMRFDPELWRSIMTKSMMKMFDHVLAKPDDGDWLMTTCYHALHQLMEIYIKFFQQISFLLEDVLRLLTSCIISENETLAAFGVTAFITLISEVNSRFTEDHWTLICQTLKNTIHLTAPTEVFLLRAVTLQEEAHIQDSPPEQQHSSQPQQPQQSTSQQILSQTNSQPQQQPQAQQPHPVQVQSSSHHQQAPPSPQIQPHSGSTLRARSVANTPTRPPPLERSNSAVDLIRSEEGRDTPSRRRDLFSVGIQSLPPSTGFSISGIPESSVHVPVHIHVIEGKCRTQGMMVTKIARDLFLTKFFGAFNTDHIILIMDALMEGYQFACSVTGSARVQQEFVRLEANNLAQLFYILEQDTMSTYLHILFTLRDETAKDSENRRKISRDRILSTCNLVVKTYLDQIRQLEFLTQAKKLAQSGAGSSVLSSSAGNITPKNLSDNPAFQDESRLLNAMDHKVPVLSMILKKFVEFPDEEFSTNLNFIYPLMCNLSLSPSAPLRHLLRQLFIRIGKFVIPSFSEISVQAMWEIPMDESVQDMEEPENVMDVLAKSGLKNYNNFSGNINNNKNKNDNNKNNNDTTDTNSDTTFDKSSEKQPSQNNNLNLEESQTNGVSTIGHDNNNDNKDNNTNTNTTITTTTISIATITTTTEATILSTPITDEITTPESTISTKLQNSGIPNNFISTTSNGVHNDSNGATTENCVSSSINGETKGLINNNNSNNNNTNNNISSDKSTNTINSTPTTNES